MIEAPLSFKINPPPKIVDLTSDFFEKDTEGVERNQTFLSPGGKSQPKPRKRPRLIVNTLKQNAIMIEVGKRKIN